MSAPGTYHGMVSSAAASVSAAARENALDMAGNALGDRTAAETTYRAEKGHMNTVFNERVKHPHVHDSDYPGELRKPHPFEIPKQQGARNGE